MKEQVKCICCDRTFWRNKLKKGQIEKLSDCICQRCKNIIRHRCHVTGTNELERLTYKAIFDYPRNSIDVPKELIEEVKLLNKSVKGDVK